MNRSKLPQGLNKFIFGNLDVPSAPPEPSIVCNESTGSSSGTIKIVGEVKTKQNL